MHLFLKPMLLTFYFCLCVVSILCEHQRQLQPPSPGPSEKKSSEPCLEKSGWKWKRPHLQRDRRLSRGEATDNGQHQGQLTLFQVTSPAFPRKANLKLPEHPDQDAARLLLLPGLFDLQSA